MRRLGGAIADMAVDAVALFRRAPWIPALVVLPELAQHVAEIHIGMFGGLEQARALSADPRRMVFGYAKIAGLVLAMLATIRLAGVRARGDRFWRGRWRPWRALAALAVFLLLPLLAEPLRPLSPAAASGAGFVLSIVVLPVAYIFVAALAGEPDLAVRRAYTAGWFNLIAFVILCVVAFAPAMGLHQLTHRLALGAPAAMVWGLMIADALIVGLLAALVGNAFWQGYAMAFAGGRGTPERT